MINYYLQYIHSSWTSERLVQVPTTPSGRKSSCYTWKCTCKYLYKMKRLKMTYSRNYARFAENIAMHYK